MIVQALFGVFLKLHVLEGTRVRNGVKKAHKWVGMSFPIFGWVQMLFGVGQFNRLKSLPGELTLTRVFDSQAIASLGFCFGEHFGQCLAHEIMFVLLCSLSTERHERTDRMAFPSQ